MDCEVASADEIVFVNKAITAGKAARYKEITLFYGNIDYAREGKSIERKMIRRENIFSTIFCS